MTTTDEAGRTASAHGGKRNLEYRPIDADTLLRTITSTIAQGILVHDGNHLLAANDRLGELLDCPLRLLQPGLTIDDFIDFGLQRGDYEGIAPLAVQTMRTKIYNREAYLTERRTPSGRILRIDSRNRGSDIAVVTYTDITASREREEELRRSRARVRDLAENDSLTGLTNRRSFDAQFHDKLEAARSNDAGFALILLDLDRFKPVNDTHGHAVGDALLQALSKRFRTVMRASDVVARIGGDEFAMLAQVKEPAEAAGLCERLKEAACEKVVFGRSEVQVGASIGFVSAEDCAWTESKEPAEKLMRAADLALYAAKREGRGRVVRFHEDMARSADERSTLETDLRIALRRDEISLHYQSQHDVRTHEIVGYEALMRWRHPVQGLVGPDRFIPVAEETGEIIALGRWALLRACCDMAGFDETSRIAVNVSPIQFARSDVALDVEHALSCSGLDPSRLEIEVTEQILISDIDSTRAVLDRIKAMGVRIALDDFGTGYSSLRYLTSFPFDKLKIDRSFIDDMLADDRAKALVSSMLALGSALDLRITAEGVETQEQLLFLSLGRCHEVQGYLLAKPMPLADLVPKPAREPGRTLETDPRDASAAA